MKNRIGLSEKTVKENTTLLNVLIADEYVLFTKTRNYHWNVARGNFQELHKFFDDQYAILDEQIDEIAERVRMLGETPVARLKDFLKLSHLKEETVTETAEMIESLLHDHEHIITHLRKDIKITAENEDAGTCDFLTKVLGVHEKMVWMLSAYQKH